MKKNTIIFFTIVGILGSCYFFTNNIDDQSEIKAIDKKIVKSKEKKDDFVYLTKDSDNIGKLLKEEKEEVTKVKYVYEEKNIKNGFIEEEGYTYYYDNDTCVTGERIIDKKKLLFKDDCKMVKNEFYDEKYYDENGLLVTGRREINNDIYYFNEDGSINKDIVIDNCYYDEEGKLFTGFKEIDGNTFYFSRDGMAKGITIIDDKKYYFDEDGHLIRNSFYDKYYLDENGIIVTGEKEISGRIYIFDETGILLNGFQVIDDKTYFLDENNNRLKGLQLIDNIRYYFDFETGELIKKDVKSVIDISSWQGDIDFDQVKNSNLVDKVIVRIGYGTTNNDSPVIDNKFDRNIKELNRVGIPYDIYIFGYAQNEEAAKLEAEYVIQVLNKYNISKDTFIWYDAELSEFEGKKYTKTMYKKVINRFISILNDSKFNNVGVYSYLYMFNKGGLTLLQKKIPKWVAQYYKRCEYEDEYAGWQYTSDGSIPGINGRVDMNIFY